MTSNFKSNVYKILIIVVGSIKFKFTSARYQSMTVKRDTMRDTFNISSCFSRISSIRFILYNDPLVVFSFPKLRGKKKRRPMVFVGYFDVYLKVNGYPLCFTAACIAV